MTTDNIIPIVCIVIASAILAGVLRSRFRYEFIINEGFVGLLYHEGKLTEALLAGRHIRWGRHFRVVPLETRKTLLPVAGQEVLTADNIGVKISLVLTTQVSDPLKSARAADSVLTHIYNAAQAAVRTVVAGFAIDALLTQRVAIAVQLRELIAPSAGALGLEVHAVEVRDVMLPGELRKAFNEVLKAKQEGQAALERARGETAALRSLVNAARLVEGQPALTTLRLLQTLESSGQTVVLNDLSALTTRASKNT